MKWREIIRNSVGIRSSRLTTLILLKMISSTSWTKVIKVNALPQDSGLCLQHFIDITLKRVGVKVKIEFQFWGVMNTGHWFCIYMLDVVVCGAWEEGWLRVVDIRGPINPVEQMWLYRLSSFTLLNKNKSILSFSWTRTIISHEIVGMAVTLQDVFRNSP